MNNVFASMKLVVIGAVLVGSLSAYAADQQLEDNFSIGRLPSVLTQATSFARFMKAKEEMLAAPSVQNLLRDSSVNALSPVQLVKSDLMETTKFQHFYKGLEVIGSMTMHHQGLDNSEIQDGVSRFDLDTTPAIRAEEASYLARHFAGDRVLQKLPELKILPELNSQGSARLVYFVTFERDGMEPGRDVILDAHTGNLIADISHDIPLAAIQVYSTEGSTDTSGGSQIKRPGTSRLMGTANGSCQTVEMGSDGSGSPVAINLDACKHVIVNSKLTAAADVSARQAGTNSAQVLNYYSQVHRRNSMDDRGMDVVSIVHIGVKFGNAFWSSDLKVMSYGDGDGVETGDFAKALDVAGHEMTHGVVSNTANLIYMDESGALNEAMADFFGKMIANDGDWAMGRKLFLDPNNKGFRDLANPGNLTLCLKRDPVTRKCVDLRPYPSSVSQQFPKQASCGPANDNCWVHINATIPGHAFYLLFQKIGKQKAEQLVYNVLTHYLSQRASFKDLSKQSQLACPKMFDAATCGSVKQAFAEVGL